SGTPACRALNFPDFRSHPTAISPHRRVDRPGRLAEPFRPAIGHVETIFQPHAEAAGNVDARFVGEAHARRQLRRLAAHQVDRLVPVEPDAMPGAMRKAGQLVVRTPAERGIIAAHRIVDAAGGRAEPGRGEGGLLALRHLVPH
ncbi:hypothetical protein QU38_01360, partial [Staphylococcus aureus]